MKRTADSSFLLMDPRRRANQEVLVSGNDEGVNQAIAGPVQIITIMASVSLRTHRETILLFLFGLDSLLERRHECRFCWME